MWFLLLPENVLAASVIWTRVLVSSSPKLQQNWRNPVGPNMLCPSATLVQSMNPSLDPDMQTVPRFKEDNFVTTHFDHLIVTVTSSK